MRKSGWAVALVGMLVTTSSAHADSSLLEPPPPTPFDRGRVGFSVTLNEQTAFDHSYIAAGAGINYYVLDGLQVGLFALHEFGDPPSINEVSPSIEYVAQPLVGHSPVLPYVGAFYNHWFLGDGFADVDTVGGRFGLLHIEGHLLVGLGVIYEHTVSTCATNCDSFYPDVTLGFSL